MKRKDFSVFEMIALILSLGLVFWGCGKNTSNYKDVLSNKNNLSGSWSGSIQGNNMIVVVADYEGISSPFGLGGWLSYIPEIENVDTGTFAMVDGVTVSLYSNKSGARIIGTASISDDNTLSLILNKNSIAAGTYTLTRQ
ncbi:MAG: hypothetical protein LBD58_12855 [Treponema sp.]|jgi:hypothetical protein|nr:hypothetical protein [Treponema sp.]